ncbi:MAG: class I SAM-dependent methyltransferase [Actinomycetota bacterium]
MTSEAGEHDESGGTSDRMITDHYHQADLLARFEQAMGAIGKDRGTVTTADLAPADEFHVGGRPATEHLLDQLALPATAHVLDVGCGIGGPARFAADRFDRVTGVDLTAAYVAVGTELNRWLGYDDRIDLRHGSALDLPFADASFDGGYLLHVGMNIADKSRLLAEVHRTLKPGGGFAIYDIMRLVDGPVDFPLPWASEPETSHLATPDAYRKAAIDAGFTVTAENSRVSQARAAFERLQGQPPGPLGLHLVMGQTIGEKVRNLTAAVTGGLVGPIELILYKPA